MSYTFRIICYEENVNAGNVTRGGNAISRLKDATIPKEKLKSQFDNFMEALAEVVNSEKLQKSGFAVDEIELEISISAQGEISILTAVSGGVNSSSGIKIKLKRFGKEFVVPQ
ncbi:MAG: hypothetical protein LUH55_03355 [Bacteroides thetaiotaomicron]|nr:hypothetical protein [Bacteroides thetaiotaomicron]